MIESNTKRLIKSIEFAAFDTETTGLWAPVHRIVEIAGVRFQFSEKNTNEFQSLVNPQREMPRDVIEVHGITDEMVADADKIDSVLPKFLNFCGDKAVLIAHNALFDISFIACECDRIGIERPANLVLDTVTVARKAFPELESYSLLALAQQLKLTDDQTHRALDDARLVRMIFVKAIEKLSDIKSVNQLVKEFGELRVSDWQQESVALPDKFSDIARALESNLRLEINYRSNDKPPKLRIIRPLTIHSIRSRIYLNAFCELAGEERTFRLDRIESWRVLE